MAGSSCGEKSGFAIIVAPGLWGRRVEVTVEPPVSSYPLSSFRSHAEAIAVAKDLSRAKGWPIRDHCNANTGE